MRDIKLQVQREMAAAVSRQRRSLAHVFLCGGTRRCCRSSVHWQFQRDVSDAEEVHQYIWIGSHVRLRGSGAGTKSMRCRRRACCRPARLREFTERKSVVEGKGGAE